MSMSTLTVLCVCTYRRPEGLSRLLDAVKALESPGRLEIVVIDNHEGQAGFDVCRRLPSDYPFKVHAKSESGPGITFARNAALNAALALEPANLAFLDDDEWPSPQWLVELRKTMKHYDADIVGGPTLTDFPEDTSDEFRNNPYFGADMDLNDGQVCQLQAAGNAYMKAAIVKPLAPEFFHPDFANSCGEDLAFFTQLHDRGARMHWSANAVVHESVDAYRLSEQWLRSRVITVANSRVRVMQMLRPGLVHSLERGVKTCALLVYSLLRSALGVVVKRHAKEAQMLRWKFLGKFSAHMNRSTSRLENSS